ncbi:DUF2345 domain-containing protein, partial [Collimonas humicola]|uniref:DUF2345 domain-containing protein n=1 Tax=Collimonas humicola TaxID=2825886 RepID=UPI001E369CD0
PNGGNQPGGRSNHLVLDDTNGKIQAQLKSDHQHSQLSLGSISRIEDNAGRKDARGEGWELRTDGHGVARAAKGMLITTEARNNAAAHIKDMGETVQRLTAARDQHESLADAAQQAGAQEKQGQQSDVAQTLKAQNDAIKGGGASEEGSFPELSQPHLVLASPAGIETTTAQSTHIASDEHTAITTGKSLSIASGDSWFASIRNTFRLFVQKTGIKMVAAAGDIDVQALTDSINLLAKLNITQTANRITITAKEEVVINGGGSYTKFNASGIEKGTNGAYVAHAASHSLPGPQAMGVDIRGLPAIKAYNETFRLLDPAGNPLPNIKYTVTGANDEGHEALTTIKGDTPRVHTDAPQKLKFSLQWAEISIAEEQNKDATNNIPKDQNG